MQYTDRQPWQCILKPVNISSVTEPYIHPTWMKIGIDEHHYRNAIIYQDAKKKNFKTQINLSSSETVSTYFFPPICLIFITTADNMDGFFQEWCSSCSLWNSSILHKCWSNENWRLAKFLLKFDLWHKGWLLIVYTCNMKWWHYKWYGRTGLT